MPTHITPFLAIQLQPLDWAIIAIFFVVVIGIGIVASRFSGKSSENYFLGGRTMPWWLLGISMVACTFSCDTPNLVTDIVRNNGVSGNWVWWAFLLTGMLTVFIYAKLWRLPRCSSSRLSMTFTRNSRALKSSSSRKTSPTRR
jgi:Na+/proline symporter